MWPIEGIIENKLFGFSLIENTVLDVYKWRETN